MTCDHEGHYPIEKYNVDRKPVDLEFLMSRWSSEMHVFVTAWGEFSPTLEEVAVIVSLPIFDEAQVVDLVVYEREN